MIISITGTPGTGKTEVSAALAKKINANSIDIGKLIDKEDIPRNWDKRRGTRIVSTIHLKKAVEKNLVKDRTNIVHGHLSHFLKSDFMFIMRCNPIELRKRLEKRGWPAEKINENIQAEILDEITIEAIESKKSGKIYEINTTGMIPEKAASLIMKILKYSSLKKYQRLLDKYKPGHVEWSERYKNILIKQ